VELLAASDRVREDCAYALENGGDDYDELGVHLVLRRWDGAIPPSNEFRGIVWNGQMNALTQYYHGLYFPELESLKAAIEGDLRTVHSAMQPRLSAAGFESYLVDLAWLGPGNVRVIEVNPFDGVGLGTMAASTCLFLWDSPEDRRTVMEGPFAFRLRSEPQTEYDLKRKMNSAWREILFPSRWKPSADGVSTAKATGKAKGKATGSGKGGNINHNDISTSAGKGYAGGAT